MEPSHCLCPQLLSCTAELRRKGLVQKKEAGSHLEENLILVWKAPFPSLLEQHSGSHRRSVFELEALGEHSLPHVPRALKS